MIERRYLEERVRLLRRTLVQGISDEERLYHRYVETRQDARRWQRRAELARRRGHEELATRALERVESCRRMADAARAQYEEQRRHLNRMQRRLHQAEADHSPGLAIGPERRDVERALLALDYDPVADRLAQMEREEQLEGQLAELKARLGQANPHK